MRSLATRALLSCAAIGVAGALLILPVTLILGPAAVSFVVLWGLVQGLWYAPGALAQRLLRLPGVALLTTVLLSLVLSLLTGGYSGFLTTAAIGVLLELPFAITRYRRWGIWMFVIQAVLATVVNVGLFSLVFDYAAAGPVITVGHPIATLVGVVGAVLIAVLIADRLRAAGLGRTATARRR